MLEHQDLRQALIRATVERLRDHAPTEISLRALARQLEVSSGAPYHHFADRSALFAAVALEGWQAMSQALLGCAQDDPRQRLEAAGRAYLDFALRNPEHYRVMFLPELKDPARFPELHAASTGSLQWFTLVVAEALGQRDAPSPEQMTRVVGSWSTVHGFALLYSSGVLEGKVDRLTEAVLIEGVIAASVRAALG